MLVPLYYLFINSIIKDKKKALKSFAILIGIHAVLFRALANPYNYVDTEGYAKAYQNLSDMSWSIFLLYGEDWGVGYVLLNLLLGYISSDPQVLFVTLSVISIVPVVWFYYKTSNNMLLSMMIFLTYPMMYYMGFGVVRQHAAIAFALLSLYYIDKYKVSIPLTLLACSFHTSAILILPFFVWRKLDIKKMGIIKYLILIVIGVLSVSIVGSLVIDYIGSSRYEDVLDEGTNSNVVPVILVGSLLVMSAMNKLRYYINDKRNLGILSFLMYGLIIAIFSMGMASLGRASLYFIYVVPVIITWLSKYHSKFKSVNTIYIFMVFVLIGIQLYLGYQPEMYDYSFYWD